MFEVCMYVLSNHPIKQQEMKIHECTFLRQDNQLIQSLTLIYILIQLISSNNL